MKQKYIDVKKVLKNNKELIIAVLFVAFAVFITHSRSYSNGYYYVAGGDVKTQWYQFYTINRRETINALRGGYFPFYSWVTFLGTNIWAAHASYGLFDIFNILTYPLKLDYYVIYDIQCYAKILTGTISFYFLIYSIYKDKKVSGITGICYGLSSFAIYFQSQPSFLSFFAFMPLYFLGIEEYLQNNKTNIFVLMTFILLITNYYLFVSATLFSPVYFTYRYYNHNGNLNRFIPSSLKLVLFYMLGVMMASVIVLPTFFYITQAERVGNFSGSLFYDDLKMYLHLLINAFLPSHNYIYRVDIFNRAEHTLKEICMYAGSIIPIINIQILGDKNKKFKRSSILLYITLILLIFIPYGNTIMHGLSEVCFRWLILVVMINLIIAARYLCSFKDVNLKLLFISMISAIILIITVYLTALKHSKATIFDYSDQFILVILVVSFIILYSILIFKNLNKLFYLLLVFELILFCYNSNSYYGYGGTKDNYKNVRKVLASDIDYHELQNYLDGLESDNYKEFYRTYIPYDSLYWSYSKNMNLIYNIKGLMSYSSTTAPSFTEMKYINYEEIVGAIDWEYDIKDPNLLNFYATKYSITTSVEEIPFLNYEIITDSYRGSFLIAKNNDYDSLGRTYSKTMTTDHFKENGSSTELLLDYVITDELYMNSDYSKKKLENIVYFGNQLSASCNIDNEELLIISLPYDEGWKILVNGNEIDYFKANGGNICIKLNEGDNFIQMYFIPKGFKIGAVITALGFVAFFSFNIIKCIVSRKSQKISR